MVSPTLPFPCAGWAAAARCPEVLVLPPLVPLVPLRLRVAAGAPPTPEPTANMSSKRAKTKTTKKRPQRATSNVFAMFDQSQIQEFKEAFNMIDQNRDGFIDKEDLHDMLASLGKNPTDEYLDAMMNEAPGPINFTMFLTMFGEKLNGTDPEDVIRNAFACFDEEATDQPQGNLSCSLTAFWFPDFLLGFLSNELCLLKLYSSLSKAELFFCKNHILTNSTSVTVGVYL
uniref:EF-hand domain-containing protein n=1 Tax=Anser cygnoides TaxID=8845 RepID=A0A8B9IG84_ANSCY